jgi:hypothetical protein
MGKENQKKGLKFAIGGLTKLTTSLEEEECSDDESLMPGDDDPDWRKKMQG